MLKKIWLIWFFYLALLFQANSQPEKDLTVQFIRKETKTLPERIVNIPFFIINNTQDSVPTRIVVKMPGRWKLITKAEPFILMPEVKKFSVVSVQIPSRYPVGKYDFGIYIENNNSGQLLAEYSTSIEVEEIENISLQLIESKENILAGEKYEAKYILQNLGNTDKNVFIETQSCIVEGESVISLQPGESKKIKVVAQTSEDIVNTERLLCNVRALIGGKVQESIMRPVMIFPVKNAKRDLYFRYPVSFTSVYLAAQRDNNYQSTYQLELKGNGTLDPQGKHKLEFLARGPNNADLSYLGLYDQYYIAYSNKNIEVMGGQQSFRFTPLTESSRYGLGFENKIILNNGLGVGFFYVKPRFYEEIDNEMAVYTQFEKDRNNLVELYYVRKQYEESDNPAQMISLNSRFQPFPSTTLELEFSRGFETDLADNAFRGNINSQFSIFRLAGNYYYAGKNYPGYFSNSTFYSGSLSAQIFKKMSIGISARQDFQNAELDTFFVTAPFSSSYQTYLNYKIAPRAYLKFYWRESERKDRLSNARFHYKTQSFNAQYRQRINRFEFALLGQYGQTENYLLEDDINTQSTYNASVDLGYRFNPNTSLRFFGSYSNINSFISEDQPKLTAGMSANSQLFNNLRINLQLQNSYNIEDYYRNRNLMQLNLDYKFLKQHEISVRSYYTLFRGETENPELYLSANYTFQFGVPLKQILKAGDVKGKVINDDGEPYEGVVLNLLNKTTITDKNGEFSFLSVPPGLHLVTIDNSKFNIDEIPAIPLPIKVEVIEDQQSIIPIKITSGAKITGKIVPKENNGQKLKNNDVALGNIIVELYNDIKQYRITANNLGEFSFPLVIPGPWKLKIYVNSIPSGFELKKSNYMFDLETGEKKNIEIDIKRKKRNIIFKSQNISLSNSNGGKMKPLKLITNEPISLLKIKPDKSTRQPELKNESFYAIQIGAFSEPVNPESSFFKGEKFDIEKQINNLYKYFIGHFQSLEEAIRERDKLREKFRGAFVVSFKDGKLINIDDQ